MHTTWQRAPLIDKHQSCTEAEPILGMASSYDCEHTCSTSVVAVVSMVVVVVACNSNVTLSSSKGSKGLLATANGHSSAFDNHLSNYPAELSLLHCDKEP